MVFPQKYIERLYFSLYTKINNDLFRKYDITLDWENLLGGKSVV